MEKAHIKIGVEIIVKRNGKILFGKRLGKAGAGEWGLPGGHLDYGESLIAGATRELLEETGLTVGGLEFLNVTNDPREDAHYLHFVFLAQGAVGEPKVLEPEKCEKWEWFSPNELPSPIFYGHKKLLQAVVNNQLLDD